MARLYGLIEGLACDKRTNETAGESVTRAVRVDDLRVRERVHGEDLGVVRVVGGDDGRALRAVRDDDRARASGVRLGLRRERLRDRREVLLREARRARPCLGLGLVADDDVAVRDDLLQLHAEELGDEWRGEVQDEDLRGVRRQQVRFSRD